MKKNSIQNIVTANLKDAAAITHLLNQAYRGATAKQGWTHEAGLIGGEQRTIISEVESLIKQNGSLFFLYKKDDNICGCVNLRLHGNKLYLGMLAVSPMLQNEGIGKQLLNAANDFAIEKNCKSIYMTVISLRSELIDWYKRHGYVDTGHTEPFIEDEISGKHLQPLEFVYLEKAL